MTPVAEPDRRVSFGEAPRFRVKLGWISFGEPAGQIAILGAAAFLALYRLKLDVLRVVLVGGLLGLFKTYLFG